jgi:voltage-gated potassium channel
VDRPGAQRELGEVLVGRRRPRPGPLAQLLWRGALAVALLLFVTVVVWLGRDGYVDDTGGSVTFLAALYYASVSVTTTGYGDITPVTDGARLATVLLVTPARILFLLLLLGTTIELLTERWRDEYRRRRWRSNVDDHYVICGYGVKGRAAARALRDDGVDIGDITVIEPGPIAAGEASRDGYTVVLGDSTRTKTLKEARVDRARAVIVATDRDDSAVLTTLTARELAPKASIVAAVREDENRHLLEQSGATSVVTSSETAGRLLGVTSRHPEAARVVEDLLDTAHGLMLVEREVSAMEVGRDAGVTEGQVPVAVMRSGRLHRIDDDDCMPLREGDLLVSLAGASAIAERRKNGNGNGNGDGNGDGN